jgi:hypothetical protein
MGRTYSTHGRRRYRSFKRKQGRKIPIRKPRHRRKDNIKTDLRGIEWVDIGYISLAQDKDQRRAFVHTVMKLRVP